MGTGPKAATAGCGSGYQGAPAGGIARMLSLGRLSTRMNPEGTSSTISYTIALPSELR